MKNFPVYFQLILNESGGRCTDKFRIITDILVPFNYVVIFVRRNAPCKRYQKKSLHCTAQKKKDSPRTIFVFCYVTFRGETHVSVGHVARHMLTSLGDSCYDVFRFVRVNVLQELSNMKVLRVSWLETSQRVFFSTALDHVFSRRREDHRVIFYLSTCYLQQSPNT